MEVKDKGERSIKRDVNASKAEKLNLNARQQQILNYFFDVNSASVDDIKRKFDLVRRTTQRDLSRLVELGFLKIVSKSKTDPTRYYQLL